MKAFFEKWAWWIIGLQVAAVWLPCLFILFS